MKKFLSLVLLLILTHSAAQILNPVQWELSVESISPNEFDLVFTANIDEDWAIYAQEVEEGLTATQASVSFMPGAWSAGTTIDMLTWVKEERYRLDNGEDFQRYHARRINERRAAKAN